MYCGQGRSHSIKSANKWTENGTDFKFLGRAGEKLKFREPESRNQIKFGERLIFFFFGSESCVFAFSIKIKTNEALILSVVWCEFGTWSLALREGCSFKIWEGEALKMIEGKTWLRTGEQIKEDEMGLDCSTKGKEKINLCFRFGILREWDHLEELGVDAKIILKRCERNRLEGNWIN